MTWLRKWWRRMSEYLRPVRTRLDRVEAEPLPPFFDPRAPQSGPTVPPPEIKTALLLWYTFDQQNPTSPAQNVSSSMTKGYNWGRWRDATLAKIVARGGNPAEIVESNPNTDSGTISFTGAAVWDFASCFDLVICGHSPPVYHLQQIKSRSTGASPIVITGMHNFESYPQAAYWNPIMEGMRAVSKVFAFQDKNGAVPDLEPNPGSGCDSDGENGYNQLGIDKYESTDRAGAACAGSWPAGVTGTPGGADASNPASKHTWDSRTDHAGHAPAMAAAFGAYVSNGSYSGTLDGAMWDVVDDGPYAGSATNAHPASYTPTAYRAGWAALFAALAPGGLQQWGNCADDLTYTAAQVPRRMHEHWFRKWNGVGFEQRTLGELQASIDTMIRAGVTMLVCGFAGPGNVTPWFTGTGPGGNGGTWADLRAKIGTIPQAPQMFYVLAGAMTTGGYLMHQPEFTAPS